MNLQILEQISKLDWNQLSKRLMAVSVFWSKMYFGDKWKVLPKGYTQDDVVQESIRRAFSREWEAFDEDTFCKYLFGACRSIISNLKKSANIQKTDRVDLFFEQVTNDEEDDIEMKFGQKETLDRIESALGQDDHLITLYRGILSGFDYNEIASDLQITVKEVYNLKKRLIRIIEKIAKEL